MSNETIIHRSESPDAAEAHEVEETLEALINLAKSERRDFLAYLLRMALIEARNELPDNTCLPH
jgi:hypothetical protein